MTRILTYTGQTIDPLKPTTDKLRISDIAHALAKQCRFTGHTRSFYSVGQHCINVSRAVWHETGDPVQALQGLLHDASEAYLCDIAAPLKRQGTFAAYRAAEQRLWRVIAERWALPEKLSLEVQLADQRMVTTEAVRLMATMTGKRNWPAMPYTDWEVAAKQLSFTGDQPWRKTAEEFGRMCRHFMGYPR